MQRWRGLKALLHDAVDETTRLIAEAQASVGRNVRRVTDRVDPIADPAARVDEAAGAVTAGVLGSVRWVNRAVEQLTDAALDALFDAAAEGAVAAPIPMRADLTTDARVVADAAIGLLNGFIGDSLGATHPGLDLGLHLRAGDRFLALGEAPTGATRRLVVLVHGMGATEWSWCFQADRFFGDPAAHIGGLLARDLGFTSVYVRYNTGRAVGENGRRLDAALEAMVAHWPGPLDEIVLIGHSMGGLVARAACASAQSEGHRWITRLRHVVTIASPHEGAPLAWLANLAADVVGAVDLPATRVIARILDARSAGVRDLARGVADPLVPGVAWLFISGTITTDADHPLGQLVGDLLVRTGSASGPVAQHATFTLHAPVQTVHVGGLLHQQLQVHPDVYAQIHAALGSAKARGTPDAP